MWMVSTSAAPLPFHHRSQVAIPRGRRKTKRSGRGAPAGRLRRRRRRPAAVASGTSSWSVTQKAKRIRGFRLWRRT
ncbi:unnamed protein product [Bursaphelenchus okinawaensis]|uniref:Uncharacterized protein n=1 Tax=Bursaphelenchus okinawaensis TaxID=465554 RepID=A0A811JV40_9BILA|nr:unnamed protein product [Bursaphelenchus okinawaensis]CAG9084678.1 unnamed protein product [Bursaphelenchus okinawaensis]